MGQTATCPVHWKAWTTAFLVSSGGRAFIHHSAGQAPQVTGRPCNAGQSSPLQEQPPESAKITPPPVPMRRQRLGPGTQFGLHSLGWGHRLDAVAAGQVPRPAADVDEEGRSNGWIGSCPGL